MSILIQNNRGVTYGSIVQMHLEHCCNCGIPFMIPEELYNELRRSSKSFYCPNGHSQHYTDSVEQILRKQLEKKEKELNSMDNQLKWTREQRDNALNSKRTIAGHLTRIKNRVKNGVCPCCNRAFQNLAGHMKTQHPGFNHKQD